MTSIDAEKTVREIAALHLGISDLDLQPALRQALLVAYQTGRAEAPQRLTHGHLTLKERVLDHMHKGMNWTEESFSHEERPDGTLLLRPRFPNAEQTLADVASDMAYDLRLGDFQVELTEEELVTVHR